MCLARLNKVPHPLSSPDVIIRNNGILLLILPSQILHIPRGDRDHIMRARGASDDRNNASEQNIPVSRDDAAGHCGDKHVYGSREDFLTAFLRGRERRDRGGKRGFEGEGFVESAVDTVFGADGLLVAEETGGADLLCETSRRT